MEKKIITIMVALIIVAAAVVATIVITAGGTGSAGGFTKTFDKLVNPEVSVTFNQRLSLPDDWEPGDTIRVSDRIVDMYLYSTDTILGTTVYTVTLYFVYMGEKWTDEGAGTYFYVPSTQHHDGWMSVNHGLFWLRVSSPTNIAADYSIGDVIGLKTALDYYDETRLAFHTWSLD